MENQRRHFASGGRILISYDAMRRPADALVDFTYFNFKTGRESVKKQLFTFAEAVRLAERRSADGRYRNYRFIID